MRRGGLCFVAFAIEICPSLGLIYPYLKRIHTKNVSYNARGTHVQTKLAREQLRAMLADLTLHDTLLTRFDLTFAEIGRDCPSVNRKLGGNGRALDLCKVANSKNISQLPELASQFGYGWTRYSRMWN